MSAVAAPRRPGQLPLEDERTRREACAPKRTDRHPHGGGGLTLEQRLDRVWEGLLAAGAAECPLCGSQLERAGGAGRCGGCGTTLS